MTSSPHPFKITHQRSESICNQGLLLQLSTVILVEYQILQRSAGICSAIYDNGVWHWAQNITVLHFLAILQVTRPFQNPHTMEQEHGVIMFSLMSAPPRCHGACKKSWSVVRNIEGREACYRWGKPTLGSSFLRTSFIHPLLWDSSEPYWQMPPAREGLWTPLSVLLQMKSSPNLSCFSALGIPQIFQQPELPLLLCLMPVEGCVSLATSHIFSWTHEFMRTKSSRISHEEMKNIFSLCLIILHPNF